ACGVLGGCASTAATGAPRDARASLASIGLPAAFHVSPDSGLAPLPAGTAAPLFESGGGHAVWHTGLLYTPNRTCDPLAIVRARLRLGPGLAFDIRATEAADFFVGAYGSIWVGIPGPRREASINWPFGLESKNGAEISFLDATTGAGADPHYGAWEFGLGV